MTVVSVQSAAIMPLAITVSTIGLPDKANKILKTFPVYFSLILW
jgi:hypothetical protein